AALIWILRRETRKAEADLKAMLPAELESEEGDLDENGKRPGQFGIRDLFVLTTVAAVAFGIVRLPIYSVAKIFALLAVWLCFLFWAKGKPTPRQARSLSYQRRLAVLNAMGSFSALAPYLCFQFQKGSRPLF